MEENIGEGGVGGGRTLYHGCCMLTNQIAQLEVGNFHKHLPRGGYFFF